MTSTRPRIVTVPHTSPSPHRTWRAYCRERPGIGSFYADTEEAAMKMAMAALEKTDD